MRRAGFTLVEMVVALTVGLLALAGVYQVFRVAHQSVQQVEGLDRRLQSARRALRTIQRDLTSLHLLPNTAAQGEPAATAQGAQTAAVRGALPQMTFLAEDYQEARTGLDLDTLRFTATANDPRYQPYPTSDLVEIYLYVDNDPATEEEGLTRQINYWPNLLPEELQASEEDLPRSVVAPEVRGMNLRFLDDQANEDGTAEWVDEWVATDRLPAAIEVILFLAWDTDPETGEVRRWLELPQVIPLIRRTVIEPPVEEEEAATPGGTGLPGGESGLTGGASFPLEGGSTP